MEYDARAEGEKRILNIKEQAESLRKQGMTYKQISEALEGKVSVDWCKRQLKDIKKEKISDACIEELVRMATKPEGITVYEANAIIFKHNEGKTLTKDQIKNIRKKAQYADKGCLFRPAWMDATNPIESYKSLMAYSLHLLDEFDNVVRHYTDSYPSVNAKAVKYELMKHVFPKISPEPLPGRIMRSETISEQLSERGLSSVNVGVELGPETNESRDMQQTDLFIREKDMPEYIHLSEVELDGIWSVDKQHF